MSPVEGGWCGAGSQLPPREVVFIVDGDALVRESLVSLVRSAGRDVFAFSSAEDFLALPRTVCAGCLLVEQHLPGLSGLDLQEVLSAQAALAIVFMSQRVDVQAAVRAMKAGAREYLAKPIGAQTLLSAIEAAMAWSRERLDEFTRLHVLQDRYELLSHRERQVMQGVVTGRLNKQVGGDLGISEITVKAHRGQVMRKMQATSLAALIGMAATLGVQQGLCLLDPVGLPAPPRRRLGSDAGSFFYLHSPSRSVYRHIGTHA